MTHEEVDGEEEKEEAKEDEEAAPNTDGEGVGAGEAAEEGGLAKEEAGEARSSRAPAAARKGKANFGACLQHLTGCGTDHIHGIHIKDAEHMTLQASQEYMLPLPG